MKKTILFAVAIIALASASCRKERTCDCKTVTTEVITGFGAQTTIQNSDYTVTEAKQKKTAFKYATNCFSNSYVTNESHGSGNQASTTQTTYETTCDLK